MGSARPVFAAFREAILLRLVAQRAPVVLPWPHPAAGSPRVPRLSNQRISSMSQRFRPLALTAAVVLASVVPLAAQKPDSPKEIKVPQGPEVPHTPGGKQLRANLEVATQGSRPNAMFEATQLGLGTFMEGEIARGLFQFHNPYDREVRFAGFKASCTCSSAKIKVARLRYELRDTPEKGSIYQVTGEDGADIQPRLVQSIPVPAGGRGVIEVETDLHNVAGGKQASLTFSSTEEKLPAIRLDWSANVAQMFQLVPNEVHLNQVQWDDQRKFTVRVVSPMQPDFEILGHDPLPEHIKVEYRKVEEGPRPMWIIEGTYGPNIPESGGGAVIQFETDLPGRKSFPLRIIAWVEGPLEVTPGSFLQFGQVQADEGKTVSVEFKPNDGFDLQVERIEVLQKSLDDQYFAISHRKEGENVFVDVEIKPGAPRRLAFGKFVVHLNHPVFPTKQFQFNGFVR
jgi:hypothetical protein